jgi:integrase
MIHETHHGNDGFDLSPLERLARQAARDFECCRDATSVAGWSAMKRRHPETWPQVLAECFSGDHVGGTALGDFLQDGAGGLLVPTSTSDTTVPKTRKAARHVDEVLGKLRLSQLDEPGLERARARYVAAKKGSRSSALISSDLRVLRQAVRLGRAELRLSPVAHGWRTARPHSPVRREQRSTPSLRQARSLMAVLEPLFRVAVALIVGVGLRTAEVLRLRGGDMDLIQATVRVRGRNGSHLRPLPAWMIILVWEAWPGFAIMEPGRLLFESPRLEGKPRTDLGRALRQAAEEAGLCAKGRRDPRFTPNGLRLLWQAVARRNELPSAVVRGVGEDQALRVDLTQLWLGSARPLALRWTELLLAPGMGPDEHPHVPRRSPKGVGPTEPEWPNRDSRRWRRKAAKKMSLPPGCQEVDVGGMKQPVATGAAPTTGQTPDRQPERQPELEAVTAESAEGRQIQDAFVGGAMAGVAVGALLGAHVGGKKGVE